ncbi:unnamed protein product [Cyprideis torosa]|uniref:histidinol dehydrogenase n=1 Tax=Cyprideis torosa TaxID=163714 RepID=A0A7R8ZWW1_9CRUS|nr:unnamed protein product [Cyprideis torosa]CAG0906095.1 unnamed protein product [Cyprideis torosa]
MQGFTHRSLQETLKLIERPASDIHALLPLVQEVFQSIEKEGDKALLGYIEKFEKASINLNNLKVGLNEIEAARTQLDDGLVESIDLAYNNIRAFHDLQKSANYELETMPGVLCKRRAQAIDSVGLYIPGGSAPLFSTVLMLGIPAQIAGCRSVVICSPANEQGNLHPAILYAAQKCGIDQLYKIGGSQAIAAMSLGTPSVTKVHKIFGPGNAFVTAAKQYASLLGTAIDMPAGPSEALEISNCYAPEHLIVHCEDTSYFEERVKNCGSVFLGAYSPESAGDYASGTNHTLPTQGYAMQFSGVSVDSYRRYTTYQEISAAGLNKLGPHIIKLAEAEGLDAHALAVRLRLEDKVK